MDSQYTALSVLKERIREVLGIPVDQQLLSYGARSLEGNDARTLEDLKIFSGYTVDIAITTDYVIGACSLRLDGYYGKAFGNKRPEAERLRPYSFEWIAASLRAKGYSSEEAEKIAGDLRPKDIDFSNPEEMQQFADKVNHFLMQGLKGARCTRPHWGYRHQGEPGTSRF